MRSARDNEAHRLLAGEGPVGEAEMVPEVPLAHPCVVEVVVMCKTENQKILEHVLDELAIYGKLTDDTCYLMAPLECRLLLALLMAAEPYVPRPPTIQDGLQVLQAWVETNTGSGLQCTERHPIDGGGSCTLRKGHRGAHAGYGAHGSIVTWEAKEEA
jgi:hypothetical protein